ncbi:CAZyme family GH5 [Agaricus bisporus var. burnettii]|uniref:CAZyme family GH5 n=1 Tax=Agaricus bisporus var. burnettii TaxID=192524 RepID=A0A8H7C376_AGABI|nr:CAZyme family GH5 [Agaricus bisporus var. burnettii]
MSSPDADLLSTAQFSFVDCHGRKIFLRGVNLSGSSKSPLDQPSHLLSHFWETAEAGGESFIGQPLNLEDGSADEHLARLRGWGFNLLRFPVTWEALERAGPKKYDYEYMDYIVRVLVKCKQYGFRVYMDPHQDTWSRFSGGSGAPFWTLPACGIDPYHISATQAALLHSEYPLPHNADPSTFPAMIWGTNYGRLFSLTLFTLFFAGRTFAPNCIIDDMNIQDYLQSHYISAFGELADRIRQADEEEGTGLRDACIIGWDTLNEPAEGLVSWDDLNKLPMKQGTTLKKGTTPTPAQSLRLGMGQPQTVECWDFGTFGPKRTGTVDVNPKGRKVWAEIDQCNGGELPDGTHPRWGWKRDISKWPLGTCVWALHGVWDIQSGYMLQPDYFKYHPTTGIEVEFMTDFWLPHFKAYGERIRSSHPNAILFVQPPVFALPPRVDEEILKGRCAYTGHYYDGLTLITKHWNWFNADSLGVLRGKYRYPLQAVKIGEKAIRKSLMEQIAMLKDDARLISTPCSLLPSTSPHNQYPTVIGEIGTPFDMDDKHAYFESKGDYKNQEKALDASLNACDGSNNVAYTVWTYIARGHSHQWGDAWNGEDLSLWSCDDMRCTYGNGDAGDAGCGGVSNGVESGLRARAKRWSGSEKAREAERKAKSESQARLLSGGGGRSTALLESANASMLSLNTISTRGTNLVPPLPGAGDEQEQLPTAPSILPTTSETSETSTATIISPSSSSLLLSSACHDDDPFDFLTDGARAVRAFCRPRPVKVLGDVVDTKFDIGKAEFKCVIRVPPSTSIMSRNGQDEITTEFFIPLVHFASHKLLENSKVRWYGDVKTKKDKTMEMDPPKEYGYRSAEEDEMEEGRAVKKRVLEGIEDREDLFDIEVKVSHGRWNIKGQTLYWSYNQNLEVEEEMVIEVKRRGGAIKVRQGGWVEVPDTASLRERKKSWLCDCTDGCIIM